MAEKPRIEAEFLPHYQRYRDDPSPANAGALLKALRPVVDLGVRTYGGGDSPLIRSRARRIVLDALPSYDPARASFKTHLMPRLQGLQRYAGKLARGLSVPELVALDSAKAHATRQALVDELGRDPSDEELAMRSGLSSKRLAYVRRYRPAIAEGQLRGAFADAGDGDDADANDPAVAGEDTTRLYAQYLYPDLGPRDQVILEHALGLNGHRPIPAKAVAAKLGISPSAVAQRARKIQAMLDQIAEQNAL